MCFNPVQELKVVVPQTSYRENVGHHCSMISRYCRRIHFTASSCHSWVSCLMATSVSSPSLWPGYRTLSRLCSSVRKILTASYSSVTLKTLIPTQKSSSLRSQYKSVTCFNLDTNVDDSSSAPRPVHLCDVSSDELGPAVNVAA